MKARQRMIHVHDSGARRLLKIARVAVYRLLVLQRLESQNEVEFALLQSVHQFLHGAVLDVELLHEDRRGERR